MESYEAESELAVSRERQDLLGVLAVVTDAQGRIKCDGLSASYRFILKHLAGTNLYSHYAGRQAMGPDAPALGPDTTVSVQSAGKFLTHIAALQLVDKGIASLDEPIYHLVPELREFPIISLDADSTGARGFTLSQETKSITLRHILTNSSGISSDEHPIIRTWLASGSPALEVPEDAHGIIKICASPRLFEPGAGWYYGHDVHVLQIVIERASKQPFVEYMREHVFLPLGMNSTTYGPAQNAAVKGKLLQLVERAESGGIIPLPDGTLAGLASSILDLQKLFTDLLSPSPVLLSEQVRTLLFEPGLASSSGALQAFRAVAHEYAAQVGIGKQHTNPPVNYTCAGAMVVEAGDLDLPAGTLTWDGMPNVAWAIHLDKGIAMLFATQLLPEYEEKALQLRKAFFRAARSQYL